LTEAAYRKYLLTVLLLILAFNAVDRLALGLLLQSIKTDLHMSDTQLGVLTGIAFAAFYSVMGIPIARWADRGNRVTLIAMTTALWSAAVAVSALAGNFAQLMLIRIGVAVGEAGCVPPAHSLIADYFTREERPRAVALYMAGAALSGLIGHFVAGWLNEFFGWRATFVMLGLPGLVLALLAWLTLKEPRSERGASCIEQPSLLEVFSTLWTSRTFRHLLFCFSVMSFFTIGIGTWQPAFFIRSFGIKTGELGTWFALVAGLGSLLGTWWGGELASRYAAGNERLQLKAMAVALPGIGALAACIYLSSDLYLAFALLGLVALGTAMTSAPMFALIQTLVPERMRAMSIALIFLFANLIGMGLGPLAAGAMSDAFSFWLGDESVRYALLALSPGYLCGAWFLWRASQTVTVDLGRLTS
jgi:predicted MFS family arabinose efflux permease